MTARFGDLPVVQSQGEFLVFDPRARPVTIQSREPPLCLGYEGSKAARGGMGEAESAASYLDPVITGEDQIQRYPAANVRQGTAADDSDRQAVARFHLTEN